MDAQIFLQLSSLGVLGKMHLHMFAGLIGNSGDFQKTGTELMVGMSYFLWETGAGITSEPTLVQHWVNTHLKYESLVS